jgi:hypothetical protein
VIADEMSIMKTAKAVAAGGALGGAGLGLATWHFSRDKPFRAKLRAEQPAIAAAMDRVLNEYMPRQAVVMRVADECDDDYAARASTSSEAAAAAAKESARPSIMPAMPGILSSVDKFEPKSIEDSLPAVADDDAPLDDDGSGQPVAIWRARRVEGEHSDSETAPAPAPQAPPTDDSYATVHGGDFASQLKWLRAKETLALAHYQTANAALHEHRQVLGKGLRGGGIKLMELERQVRTLRSELRDLAEAKLSVKTHGTFK